MKNIINHAKKLIEEVKRIDNDDYYGRQQYIAGVREVLVRLEHNDDSDKVILKVNEEIKTFTILIKSAKNEIENIKAKGGHYFKELEKVENEVTAYKKTLETYNLVKNLLV